MKNLLILLALAILVFILSYRDTFSLVESKPDVSDLVGNYESTELINGKRVKLNIIDSSNLSAENIPFRYRKNASSDYEGLNYLKCAWRITNSSPSGAWCIEFSGVYFKIYKNGDNFKLIYIYDVYQNGEIELFERGKN